MSVNQMHPDILAPAGGAPGGNYGRGFRPWQHTLCPPGECRAWVAACQGLPANRNLGCRRHTECRCCCCCWRWRRWREPFVGRRPVQTTAQYSGDKASLQVRAVRINGLQLCAGLLAAAEPAGNVLGLRDGGKSRGCISSLAKALPPHA